jgi:diacylglycerol kinase (ATP)
MRRAALVLNPAKLPDPSGVIQLFDARCADAGWATPLRFWTTPEDPGTGMARQAIAKGADMVAVAGGDGTVRAVAEGMVGSGVPLAMIPYGTGNLLALNLELPLRPEDAVDAALNGPRRAIDVGRLVESPGTPGPVFVVMAGIGFDAAMMRDAPESLKSAVGWPAYLIGAARNLRHAPMPIEICLDGGPPRQISARTVMVGNVGRLQAGAELLPGASPDDGTLDVCVLAPRTAADWIVLVARTLLHRPAQHRRMTTHRARDVEVTTPHAQPRQLDGDVIGPSRCLRVRIEPAALLVCCAARPMAPASRDAEQPGLGRRTRHEER